MFKKWLAMLVAMALLVGTAMCSLAEGSAEVIPSQIGDVNGDGTVDSSDARLVLQAEVDLVQFTTVQKIAADVNGDGKINSTAARMILQYEVGLIGGFSVEPPTNSEIDFRVLQWENKLNHLLSEFELHIARSAEEMEVINEQVFNKMPINKFECDEVLFEKQAVIVILHGFSVLGPRSIIDKLEVHKNNMMVYITTGFPSIVSEASSINVIIIAVDKADIMNIGTYDYLDTKLRFQSGSEELAGWYKYFNEWLNAKM